jgi:transmembrane sensor
MATEPRRQGDDVLLREAAEWFELVHRDDARTEDLARWQAWLTGSDEHRTAFRKVEDLWHAAGQLPHPEPASRRKPYLRWAAAVASVTLLGVLWAWSQWGPFGSRDLSIVETGPGEHQELSLPDGSRLLVGARSEVTVQYTPAARYLVIQSGEAYFNVERDATRPFVVRAGSATITAVGTAFNVHRVADRVIVTVVEGSVDVASVVPVTMPDSRPLPESRIESALPKPTRLQAGQEMVYSDRAVEVRFADVGEATSWQAGKLRYRSESLRYVVPDVQRYTTRQLVIADDAVGSTRYTGTVLEGEVDDWLRGLEQVFPIEVVHVNEQTVLLKSRVADKGRESQ